MRRTWLAVAVALTGCVTPRSMVIGQMAAPVGRGATEVSVFGGVGYASQTDPPIPSQDGTTSTQQTNKGFTAPGAEANIQHGFDDHFALNVHASPAGLEPGLKWTLNTSRIAHVALLPAVGIGYASYANSTLQSDSSGVQTELAPGTTTSFTFLGGLKVLVSHRSGFYAGVGYDLLFNRSVATVDRGTTAGGSSSRTTTQTLAHQLSASVGFDIALGMVHIRPEVAFAVYPAISKYVEVSTPPTATADGYAEGFGWAIFPGFSVAVVSPQRELTDDEVEEQKAKVRKHRKSDGDTDDEDENESDEAPRRGKRSKDDDDDRPRKRRAVDDDDMSN